MSDAIDPLPEFPDIDKEIIRLLYDRGLTVIQAIPETVRSHIYVISIYIDEADIHGVVGVSNSSISLGYNTESRWQSCCPRPDQCLYLIQLQS